MEAVTHLEKVITGEVSAVTHLEKVIAGEAPPITHLEKVIAGIASPVTHLEQVWAGGSPTPSEHEYIGAVPFSFSADGTPLLDYTIYGNMTQSSECGERTKNLFDKDNVVFSGFYPHADTGAVVNTTSGKLLSIIVPCEPNTSYTWSFDRIVADLRNRVAGYSAYPTVGMACTFLDRETDSPSGSTRTVQKFTTTANTHWLILMVTGTGQTAEMLTEDVAENAQLEISTEMTSYEPYGYKIPISVNGQTNNIYIGSEPLRKAVDGSEAVDTLNYSTQQLIRRVDSSGNALAEAVTITLDVPEIPTIGGQNTIDVLTELKPSEIYIKYQE